MNPDFLAKLLAALGGTTPPATPKTGPGSIYAALGLSPATPLPPGYADTLNALTGKPNAVVRTPDWYNRLNPDALGSGPSGGVYAPASDVVTVNRNEPSPRYLLAHEYGHHLAETRPSDPYVQALNAAPSAPATFAGGPNYASANRSEQQGVAFQNAQRLVDFASELQGNSPYPRDLQRAFAMNLAEGEKMAPGTTAMLRMMIDHPIYAKHPVQQFRDLVPALAPRVPTMAPADATAMRKP